MDGQPERAESSRIRDCYQFFLKRIDEADHRESELPEFDLWKFTQIILNGVELVSITLGDDDSEYRIFESLNGKGTPLTQADLLRNYFFMRIPLKDHQVAYDDLWLPMQRSLGGSLEDFFRYEYMSFGRFVRHGDVYHAWKLRLDTVSDQQLIDELIELTQHGVLFKRMVEPEYEPDKDIARGLRRLNRWGAQTAYSFILYVYRELDAGAIDSSEFVAILQMIESFLVRRLFAGVPTNALNRLFLRLSEQLSPDASIFDGARAVLSEPGRRWPTDERFRDAILTYPLFTDSRPDQRRLILESLEESYPHKERVELSALTIEHVLPQTPSLDWLASLGITADEVENLPIHVLGNLTLTGYNPELSNSVFSKKRDLLADSHLEMNREIAHYDRWGLDQIDERGNLVAERAIEIWPGPRSK